MRRADLDWVRDPCMDLCTGQPTREPNEMRQRCIDPDQPVSAWLRVTGSLEEKT